MKNHPVKNDKGGWSFIKTPNMIELVLGDDQPAEFNPITGEYDDPKPKTRHVPCLANYVTQEVVYEQYGNRQDRILVARFLQAQPPFSKAFYDGRSFKPIEAIDAPVKGSVRLKVVSPWRLKWI